MTDTIKKWPTKPLGTVAKIERNSVAPEDIRSGSLYVGLENITGSGGFDSVREVANGELVSSKFVFTPEHVLYGKLRPYLSKIARPGFSGICSTDILPLLPGTEVDRDYLFHFLRRPEMVQHATTRSTGANLPRLSPSELVQFEIPLPKLEEQKRIAAILDKADAVRRRRQEGASLSQSLRRATFCDLFGDLKSNPLRWATKTLGDICHGRLRNGVSPSSSGDYVGSVLVLSAITGDRFDATCVKEGTFASPFTETQLVNENDFLICRGNGNVELVARAAFPTSVIEHCVFPDTMIAATVDTSVIEKEYLEEVWRTAFVRQQVESGARTTNGTHKVNQGVLEEVAFPIPPLSLQKEFGAISRDCETLREKFSDDIDGDLFNSLVQRAFKGEL